MTREPPNAGSPSSTVSLVTRDKVLIGLFLLGQLFGFVGWEWKRSIDDSARLAKLEVQMRYVERAVDRLGNAGQALNPLGLGATAP